MPLRQELIAATVPLPLPHFGWKEAATAPAITCENGLGALPPPPPTDRRNSLRRNSQQQQQQQQQLEQLQDTSDVPSTDSEVEQNESSCGGDFDELAGADAVVVSSSSSRETVRISYQTCANKLKIQKLFILYTAEGIISRCFITG